MNHRVLMLRLAAIIGTVLAALLSISPSQARPVTDCPLARSHYSLSTPLYDLLIDPRAKRLIADAGLLAKLPPMLVQEKVPSFATIISLRQIAGLAKFGSGELLALDRSLAQLPISQRTVVTRCARYFSDSRTPLTVPAGRPRLLVFEHSNGFRDAQSVDAAQAALRAMAERRGRHFIFTSNPGDINASNLRQFDAVLWNNVSGDVLTLGQRSALRSYVEGGGGFAAMHGSGGDPLYLWDWYADTLIGARFIGHIDNHQSAKIVLEGTSAITAGVSPDWSMLEEWYSFERSPRGNAGTRILLSLDEASYNPTSALRDLRMGDHPIAWTRCVGRGRSFYSAIGHRPETYSNPDNVKFLEGAINWAMGLMPADCPNPDKM